MLLGVEVVENAIHLAEENAQLNQYTYVKFICSAGKNLQKFFKQYSLPNLLILDPPRSGIEDEAISAILQYEPQFLILVSCNPTTLARDLSKLTQKYSIKAIQGVDLFPHTPHVETVVLLSWKGIDDFMYVDYAPDHHVIQGGKATYKEITEWIQETYGAHVTNLNIAQVKDKCGFEKRENYNKGTEGHRVPNCTPEKEQMIMSAFKHFNML